MKFKIFVSFLLCSVCAATAIAQTLEPGKETNRPRVIVTDDIKKTGPVAAPVEKTIVVGQEKTASDDPAAIDEEVRDTPAKETGEARMLSFGEIRARMNEAKRQMRIKPLRISMADDSQTTDIVRVAFLDYKKNKLDYVVLSKEEFLSKDTQSIHKTERGSTVRVQTIRGNGVNTPVKIFNMMNEPQLPLIVQYPVERGGKFIEMSYYVSTHPGIVTPETVNAGRMYVRNVLNIARERLSERGQFIQPKVMDIAERLALVEHVDHWRFRNEPHPNIFNDVYVLYAFNEGQTYRYSVSSAGAGGMVQMIPATYRMIRSRFPNVPLTPDFVVGMRDHVNAAQAMLLYMQMTWNDLSSNSTVISAMDEGIATPEQLMAAGYNSNPARLPGYIKRGGENWTDLIPRETKVYLQIYDSVERHVPLRARDK